MKYFCSFILFTILLFLSSCSVNDKKTEEPEVHSDPELEAFLEIIESEYPKEYDFGGISYGCQNTRVKEATMLIDKAVQEAIGTLKNIDKSRFFKEENGEISISVQNYVLESIEFLSIVRSSREDAVIEVLFEIMDVRFIVIIGSRWIGGGMCCTDALEKIGLPAVDWILKKISTSSIPKEKYKSCKKLVTKVLGEEGVKARVAFLKLNENKAIKEFFLAEAATQ